MSTPEDREKDNNYKLELLKKALISEKQKCQILENENRANKKIIIELEKELAVKDNDLGNLTCEKNNLSHKLDCFMHNSGALYPTNLDSDQEKHNLIQPESNKQSETSIFSKIVNQITDNKNKSSNETKYENENDNSFIIEKQEDSSIFKKMHSFNNNKNNLRQQLFFDNTNTTTYDQLIVNLQTQNENLKKTNEETNYKIKQIKDEFQSIITFQSERIKSLEQELSLSQLNLNSLISLIFIDSCSFPSSIIMTK
jgi:hypothetical protein